MKRRMTQTCGRSAGGAPRRSCAAAGRPVTGAEVALVTVVLVFAAWLLATGHTLASAGGFALAVVTAVIVVSRGRLPRLSGVLARLAAFPATA